jgi:superfamily II DNA or RNA helicase
VITSLFDMEKRDYRLRPYQQLAVNRFFAAVATTGAPGGIIRQPTGTGKTVCGSAIVDQWLDLGARRRVLVLCDQRQLVQQFASELAELTGRHVHIDMAEQRADEQARLTVACRQSYLPREVDGEAVSRAYKFDPADEWLVVCDEAHKFALGLKSCGHLFEHFSANPVSKRLGLTATPERGDKISLETLFPVVVSDYRYYDAAGGPCAISEGWAVPFDQRFVRVEGVDFKNLREIAGDFDENELEQVLCEQKTLAGLCEPTKLLVADRRTIIFSATVSMAHRVASYLNAKAGYVVAVAMDGTTPDLQRRDIYARFERDDFQYLCVCGLCREGFNSPGVGAIAVFRPTKSRPLAEQMKGRGSRPLRGLVDGLQTAEERLAAIAASSKPDCLIVDLVGITGLAGARTCLDCYADGVPDEVVARASTILERGEIHDPRMAIETAESELAAEKSERIRREQEEAERRARLEAEVRFNATRVGDGHGAHAQHTLGPDSPTEKQLKYMRWAGLPLRPGTTRRQCCRMIGQHRDGLPVEEICRLNRMLLSDIRVEAATSKQLWKLRSLGIRPPENCSKRQASEMIDQRLKQPA